MSDDLVRIRAAALDELRREPVVRSWFADATRLVAVNLSTAFLLLNVIDWADGVQPRGALREVGALLLLAVMVFGAYFSVLPGGTRLRVGIAAVAVVALLSLAVAASDHPPGRLLFADGACFFAELGVSLVPAAVSLVALRGFSYQPSRALVAGLAAAATGVLVLQLTCDVGTLRHLLAFHFVPAALVTIGTVVIRSRLRSRTFAP
jgi:hypothetical protein